MTNKQVVSKLRELGHIIEVYVRKDGSLRVTSIDGVKYERNQSKGVYDARELLEKDDVSGFDPAEGARRKAIEAQRKAARASRKSGRTLRTQTKEFQKEFKKLQEAVRKANKKLIKEGKRPLGVPSWNKTREAAQKAGTTVEAQLNRAKDYFVPLTGNIAPVVMVEALIAQLEEWEGAHPEFVAVKVFLENHKRNIDIYALTTTRNWAYTIAAGQKASMTQSAILDLLQRTLHEE